MVWGKEMGCGERKQGEDITTGRGVVICSIQTLERELPGVTCDTCLIPRTK